MKKKMIMGLLVMLVKGSSAQYCDPSTPVFTVNLSGQPNGTWSSTPVIRQGQCCSASGTDKCLQFNLSLDSSAEAISFNIVSGAIPRGALFYQINCGTPEPLGQPICLNGPGPYVITFCKPGNNTNVYAITSIGRPVLNGTLYVSEACSGTMSVTNLDESTITWTSVPTDSTYNSYLSCTTGCDSVTVQSPSGSTLPSFIDYSVCGTVTGSCNSYYFCDTLRINFINDLTVAIHPDSVVLCYGIGDTIITADITGGLAPYRYTWSTGATASSIRVGPGTYSVLVSDARSCSIACDTILIKSVNTQILANAGTDKVVCANNSSVQLNGNVYTASGGYWSGGSGIFSADSLQLYATYFPSAGEISSGRANLILTTTGNQGCPAAIDSITIVINSSPFADISGPSSVCLNADATYLSSFNSLYVYNWTVTGGTIQSLSNNSVLIHWTTLGTGVITLSVVDPNGCDSLVTKSVLVNPLPTPQITGLNQLCTPVNSNYQITPLNGNVYSWSVQNGVITSGLNASSVFIDFTGAPSAIVSVLEATSAGCTTTVSQNVSLTNRPVPVISGPTEICAGTVSTYTSSVISGLTNTWMVTGGTVISNSYSQVVVNWLTPGTGTVTLNQSAWTRCDSTVSLDISIDTLPSPLIIGNAFNCSPVTDQFMIQTVPGDTYQWSVTNASIIGSNSGSQIAIAFTVPGSYTVSVGETTTHGCIALNDFLVTATRRPVPIINGPVVLCEGSTVTYSSPVVSGVSNTWSVQGGIILNSNLASITVNWPSSGTGVVDLLQTAANGCDSLASLSVLVNANPVGAISGPTDVCSGYSGNYTFSPAITGTQYTWTLQGNGTVINSTVNNVTISWDAAGIESVLAHLVSAQGCASNIQYLVVVSRQPTPAIIGPAQMCEGSVMVYSALGNGSDQNTWNVSGGVVQSVTNAAITVLWDVPGTGSIRLTASNTGLCDSTVQLNVVISPKPHPQIIGATSVCTNRIQSFELNALMVDEHIHWTLLNGMIIGSDTNSNVNILWTNTGSDIITATVYNNSSCDSVVSFPINLLDGPAPQMIGRNPVCVQDTGSYEVQYRQGHRYEWTVVGGSVIGFSVDNHIDVYWSTVGQGLVSLRQTSPDGCDSLVAMRVMVNPIPTPVIAGPLFSCQSDVVSFISSSSTNEFSWMIDGNSVGTNSSTLNTSFNNPGPYTIALTEISPNGCSVTALSTLIVNEKPAAQIIGKTTACMNHGALVYSTISQPDVYYSWSALGGTVSTNPSSDSAFVRWSTPGYHTLQLHATNAITGCDSITNLTIQTDAIQRPSISAAGLIGCSPVSIAISGNSNSSNYLYSWSFGDGSISYESNPSHQYVTAGQFPIQVVVHSSFGCIDSVTSSVVIHPSPEALFSIPGYKDSYFAGQESIDLANQSAGASSYLWTFGNGDSSNVFMPSVLYSTPGIYMIDLQVKNQFGCVDSYSLPVDIIVPEEIFVPNTFTPNGDNVNDYFSMTFVNIVDAKVSILNRWGEEIFTSSDLSFKWDGTYKGRPVQNAVYVYVVAATGYYGTPIRKTGKISVVR